MIQRIGKRKYKIYAFDIESHNDLESIAKKETSMWLGSFIDEESKIEDENCYFYNMESFLDHLEEISHPKRIKGTRQIKNICIYIWNFSFEWSFMLPVLLSHKNFKFVEKIEDEDEYCYNSVSTKTCSSVWCATLKFKKSGGQVLIKDLSKIFTGSLRNVAKSFNLHTQKGDIDYRLNRLHGHIVTKEEKEYCFKDTRIIIDILLEMQKRNDKAFWSSVSMASYSMKKLIKFGWPRSYKPYQQYRKRYPELSEEENQFLRKGVEGGITYAPQSWQFKDIKQKIIHVDAHQMHPTQMYKHRFPYGTGTYFKGAPPHPITKISCCRIRISYCGVKLHSIIKLIGINFIDDYELTVWDFEIPTMKKCYNDLEIEYIDGYEYSTGMLPFRRYVAKNYEDRLIAKKEKDQFGILYYKLLNNSAYGKFLEKPHNQIFENIIDPLGIINSSVIDKETVDANAKYTYLPIGSCIPAYSRVALIELAIKFGWKNVVYFDTDSIFAIDTPEVEKAWAETNQEDFLGGWGLEEYIDRAQFAAPKRYKTQTGNNLTVKAGGINFEQYMLDRNKKKYKEDVQSYEELHEVPYEEINIVSSSWKVQRAYRVKGGTIIDFQNKEMKVPKKYEGVFENNVLSCYNEDEEDE